MSNYKFNFHTHTTFCDGKEPPETFVVEAIHQGFDTIGFSGHAPVPFENPYCIPIDKLDDFCQTIRNLKEKYKSQINILLALEADYIPGVTWDFDYFREKCKLDYIIGSIHVVTNQKGHWIIDGMKQESYDKGLETCFDMDIKAAVTAYYEQVNNMVITQHPSIIGHLDKVKMYNHNRFFTEDEQWYKELVIKSLMVIKEKGGIVEVNTRSMYKNGLNEPYPGVDILKEILKLGIPITINSDAHRPSELSGSFDEAILLLKNIGFRSLQVLRDSKWQKQAI
jgi:histidinol-phosphatase (PHP family)